MLAFLIQLNASASAQTKITLNENNTSLENVITKIGKQSGFDVIISSSLLKTAKRVSVQCKDATLEEALKLILVNQSLTYTIEEKTVVILRKTTPPLTIRIKGM